MSLHLAIAKLDAATHNMHLSVYRQLSSKVERLLRPNCCDGINAIAEQRFMSGPEPRIPVRFLTRRELSKLQRTRI